MRIVVTGPARVRELSDLLARSPEELPEGLPGTPVIGLVRALVGRDIPVSLVTCAPGVREELVLEGGGVRVRVGPYRPAHRARDGFRAERSYLARAIAAEGPGVVHAHWTYEFAMGALASGLPSLVTVRDWGPAILRYQPDPYRLVRLGMQLLVLRRAPRLTVTSPYLARRVQLVARGAPALVPNAIADDALDRQPSVAPPTEDGPRLLAINNGWSRRKNVAALLRAFALVRRAHPTAALELLGSGYGPGDVAEQWARERDLHPGVRFTGSVPGAEVRRAIRRADLLVHPSREESFGLVLVEAMAQGLPVVAGRGSGAVPWVLDGGTAGVLTDVTSPEALARSVLGLVSDHEAFVRLARRGYERARDHFTLSAVTDRYLEIYAELDR
jgi:L-malate glycosyltransferase